MQHTRSRTVLQSLSLVHRFIWLLALLPAMALHAQTTSVEPEQTRIIVKWKNDTSRTRVQALATTRTEFHNVTGLGLNARRNLGDRLDAIELDRPLKHADFIQALDKLRAQPDVEYAVPDERRHISVLPNDTYVTAMSGHSGQWYLLNTEASSINAVAAWDISKGGTSVSNSVIVAVIDTGIRPDHPDLAGKLLPGYDFVDCDQANCSSSGTHTFRTANDGDGWDADPSDPGDWISTSDQQTSFFSGCEVSNSSWHGTRTAGIIGAATNNNLGIAGIGWNTRILPVRALGKCGGYDSDIIAAMKWAAGISISGVPDNPVANRAKVINLSLGSSGTCTQAYTDVINTLNASGISVVASAGNDGDAINSPANCTGVIAVTGVRNVGSKVGFSSLGTGATIAAPAGNCVNSSGACLYSLDTTTNLGTMDSSLSCPTSANPNAKCYTTPGTNSYTDQLNANLGTSFSAPIVSGTVALMLGSNPTLTPSMIRTRLQASAKPFPTVAGVSACHIPRSATDLQQSECNCTRATCGAGLTDAYTAVLNSTQAVVPYIRGATAMTTSSTITLDASGSTLSDSIAVYTWAVQSGSATLSSSQGMQINVTAPATVGNVVLLLTVNDGAGHSATQNYSITVYGAPTARITGASALTVGQTLTLDGSTSTAQDGSVLVYAWSIVSGGGSLINPSSSATTYTAPSVNSSVTVRLTVTDQEGGSASQTQVITVTGGASSSSSSSAVSVANSGGGSGGGSMPLTELLMLGALAVMRRCFKRVRN